jgi:nitrogenase molybdenum-iron protein alpha/beta subunit
MMAVAPDGAETYRVSYDYISPYLDGVYLAINALPGTYLVYDAHNCGYHKAQKIAGAHDLFSDLVRWDRTNRIVRTDLDAPEYVMGSDDKLSKKLLQVAKRYRPEAIFVVRSAIVVFSGHDAEPTIERLGGEVDAPIILLPDRSPARDHVTGYLDATAAFLRRLRFTDTSERGVAVAGYLHDRNEGDHEGNLAELGRMLRALELPVGPVFLSGRSPVELGQAAPPEAIIDVAPDWHGARALAERIDAQHVSSFLPIGLEGTSEWVRAVGRELAREALAEQFIDRELTELVPRLEWLLPRSFLGRGALVLADRILLPGLLRLLDELGMRVIAAGCTSADYEESADAAAGAVGDVPRAPRLTDELVELVASARARGELHLVIGNGFVHRLLRQTGVPFVELGYPCVTWHALHHAPYIGFAGVRVLVERMLNALEAGDVPSAGGSSPAER